MQCNPLVMIPDITIYCSYQSTSLDFSVFLLPLYRVNQLYRSDFPILSLSLKMQCIVRLCGPERWWKADLNKISKLVFSDSTLCAVFKIQWHNLKWLTRCLLGDEKFNFLQRDFLCIPPCISNMVLHSTLEELSKQIIVTEKEMTV